MTLAGVVAFCEVCSHYSVDRLGSGLAKACVQKAEGCFATALPLLRTGRVPYRSGRGQLPVDLADELCIVGIDTEEESGSEGGGASGYGADSEPD